MCYLLVTEAEGVCYLLVTEAEGLASMQAVELQDGQEVTVGREDGEAQDRVS